MRVTYDRSARKGFNTRHPPWPAELADADERLHVSLGEIGGFSTFADYFFDGLIADWLVQSRVQNALGACDSVISQVAEVLSVCHQRLGEVEQELEQVETQRRELIERA